MNDQTNLVKAVIPLEGLHCSNCAGRVETGLAALPGVKRVSVYLPSRTVSVVYDKDVLKPAEITAKLEELGYTALGMVETSDKT